MKYLVDASSCRICLHKFKKLRSLNEPFEDDDEPPSQMLYILTGINVADDEFHSWQAVPEKICVNCQLSLSLAYQFRLKALKSQRIIRNAYRYAQSQAGIVADDPQSTRLTNTNAKGELDQPVHNDGEGSDVDENNADYVLQMDVKDEQQEIQQEFSPLAQEEDEGAAFGNDEEQGYLESQEEYEIQDCGESLGELECFNNSTEPDFTEDTSTDFIIAEVDQMVVKVQPDSPVEVDNVGDDETEYLDESFLDWEELDNHEMEKRPEHAPGTTSVNSDEEYSPPVTTTSQTQQTATHKRRGHSAVAQPPKNLKPNAHICDICGNVYEKRGRMMEHRRRHNKELRFACELCDQRFHLRENLRKHMFSHTGGKPYKCSFCSRTFFYQSVKNAHEAIHQGFKPYVCSVCNKAFGYSHALKKHKLIHAEIKQFRCKYCDKDFRLQHHLKQHEETKLHQNAVLAATIIKMQT